MNNKYKVGDVVTFIDSSDNLNDEMESTHYAFWAKDEILYITPEGFYVFDSFSGIWEESIIAGLYTEDLEPIDTLHKQKTTNIQQFVKNIADPDFKAETSIPTELYNQLNLLGIIPSAERSHNVGESNYSQQLIQPWSIMLAYQDSHNYLELDIIKRILRSKSSDTRLLDYQKCQHILDELIRIEKLKEQQ